MYQSEIDQPVKQAISDETEMSEQQRITLEQACLCAKIADDFRGQDTIVLDLTRITPIFDYFVITTGTSRRQMQAVAVEIHREMKSQGSQRIGIEGHETSSWILQDYGDVVLHILDAESRELYDLEHLWGDAQRIDWREVLGIPAPVTASASTSVMTVE